MNEIKPSEFKAISTERISDNKKISFEELKDSDMNTIEEIHSLFPQWNRLSVIKKLKHTQSGENMRFVARRNGKIVAHLKIIPGNSIHTHVAEMTSLIVSSKERGQGIGAGLMEYAISKIPKRINTLKLAVDKRNKTAISLYKKIGFEKYGLLENASKINGEFIDNLLMVKKLK